MFGANLTQLRRLNHMTQEDVAEIAGVTRQAVAKWEAGDSMPDLETGRKLAAAFEVTLDELVSFDPGPVEGISVPPRGKHLFGTVTVGEKGQIVIPAKARKIFQISPGDQLLVLGDENTGLALLRADDFLKLADSIRRAEQQRGGGL